MSNYICDNYCTLIYSDEPNAEFLLSLCFPNWVRFAQVDSQFMLDNKSDSLSANTSIEETTLGDVLKTHKMIYVDFAKEDEKAAQLVEAFIRSQGHLLLPTDKPLEGSARKKLVNRLTHCDAVITVYERSPLSWLYERLRFYQSTQVRCNKNFQTYMYKPLSMNINSKINLKIIRGGFLNE
jgi:hypothetical protein